MNIFESKFIILLDNMSVNQLYEVIDNDCLQLVIIEIFKENNFII